MVKVTKFEIIAVIMVCFLLDTAFDITPGSLSSILGIVGSSILVMGFGAILQKTQANSKFWWLCYPLSAMGWCLAHFFVK